MVKIDLLVFYFTHLYYYVDVIIMNMFRLSDHHDLAASAQACEELAAVCSEQRIWRELTRFHFTPQQIEVVSTRNDTTDWEKIYHALRRFIY